MKLTFKPINSPARAEQLRVLRNECAFAMTRDTSQITRTQQRRFFDERISTREIEGFLVMDGEEPVAYGLLLWDQEGRAWSSTGVKESRRGEGLGRVITIENVRRAHAHGVPMWAEVRKDNAGQQHICRTIGYQQVGTGVRGDVPVDIFRCDSLPEHAA